MVVETTTYQCPHCNGRLRFNGEIDKLQCEFCGSEFEPAEIEKLYAAKQTTSDAKVAGDRAKEAEAAGLTAAEASKTEATQVKPRQPLTGDPVKDYLARSTWSEAEDEGLQAYNCPACGAQLMVDQVTAVTNCPYCGNTAVVPGQLSDVLKPDYIIPFKLDKEAAIRELKNYYKGKRFLPNGFTNNNHLQEIQGVYVPFWLYSGTGMGDVTFNASNSRTWVDSKNTYVETDHYILHRVGNMQFSSVPVDGSTKMPDAHMDAIEPFDYSEMVPFSVGYLPGYLTDRYDQDVEVCKQRATNRACRSCEDAIADTASGYMEISVANARSGMQWKNVSYALMPVWMLHTRWNGNDYLFAMNGQTGKFIGDLPIDKGKVTKRFFALFLPIAAVISALGIAVMLM